MGEVADFTLGSAMYPSVGFAVGGSILTIGTLIGRRIAGPSGPLEPAPAFWVPELPAWVGLLLRPP